MTLVQFTKLDERAIAPIQAHPGEDAGWDLFALEDTRLNILEADFPRLTWIRTGIAIAVPTGYYGRIVGRSSSASKGFHVIEGIMDSGYRGEQLMRVAPLWRPEGNGRVQRIIEAGTRLAQLIIQPVPKVVFVEVDLLPPSQRGEKGFGSSGN